MAHFCGGENRECMDLPIWNLTLQWSSARSILARTEGSCGLTTVYLEDQHGSWGGWIEYWLLIQEVEIQILVTKPTSLGATSSLWPASQHGYKDLKNGRVPPKCPQESLAEGLQNVARNSSRPSTWRQICTNASLT